MDEHGWVIGLASKKWRSRLAEAYHIGKIKIQEGEEGRITE